MHFVFVLRSRGYPHRLQRHSTTGEAVGHQSTGQQSVARSRLRVELLRSPRELPDPLYYKKICVEIRKPLKALSIKGFGREAGSGNRTRINSLEGYSFTTKLRPRIFNFNNLT